MFISISEVILAPSTQKSLGSFKNGQMALEGSRGFLFRSKPISAPWSAIKKLVNMALAGVSH